MGRLLSSLLAAALVTASALPCPAQPTNLLANGSFEGGSFAGWSPNGATAVNTDARHGSWSARITNQMMDTIVATTPGLEYKVTAWLRIVNETGDDWGGFSVSATSWDWNLLAQTPWLVRSERGGDWFKVAIRFTATTPQTRLSVGYFGGPGRSMVTLADDIKLFVRAANMAPAVSASLTPATITTLPTNQSYSFSGDDPDGAIERIAWVFGDGSCSQQPNGTRRVALPGTWSARLRVGDDDGSVTEILLPWSAAGTGFPSVTVTSPATTETQQSAAEALISGTASGTGLTLSVTTDRCGQTTVTGTTNWSAQVQLLPGWNRVLVQARDTAGRVATQERLIRLVPSIPLGVTVLSETPGPVERWGVFEARFRLDGTAATHPQFPFTTSPPQGLEWVDGVTVDGLFSRDNWATVLRRPAFFMQPHDRQRRSDMEWLYPSGEPVWCVRFSPPDTGLWDWRIEVREARATTVSAVRQFAAVAAVSPLNHGPVRVSTADSRYFEFADGTVFLGPGHGIGTGWEAYSYEMVDSLTQIGPDNQDFFRWWISGALWGSAWTPWASRTLSYDGYIPPTGLGLEAAYGDGIAALRLDAANPIAFQGFMSGLPAVIPGRTYRMRVRWRTENVTGPANPARPYGVCVRWGGWPEPGDTHTLPLVVGHVRGDTPWHVSEATFTATGAALSSGHYLANPVIVLENATGGRAFVDECSVREVLPGGALGPEILRKARFNSHLDYDQRRGAGLDAILSAANDLGKYFKLVISEKGDWLINRVGPDGLPDPLGGRFNEPAPAPTHALHQWYWRHLFARFGAFRSVHSWELVNEEAPGPGDHFLLAADLARAAQADGNPHLASTSTWATLAEDAWKWPPAAPIHYADFHCYVNNTGWIEPRAALASDSARFFHEYDEYVRAAALGKPVVWGEQGIDGPTSTDDQDPQLALDNWGVWIHKILWARCGPGGVYPLYWWTDNIFDKPLHARFGAWKRFMTGEPLNNGHYQDAQATSTATALRVMGQKDLTAGRAHLWLDNAGHTWRAVINGQPVAPVSGSVSVAMGVPGSSYTLTWHDTASGLPTSTQTVTANSAGTVTFSVAALTTDTAVKLQRLPAAGVDDWICHD
jgi:hypothetical protein